MQADSITPGAKGMDARRIALFAIPKPSNLVRLFILLSAMLTLVGHWYITSRHVPFGDPALRRPYNIFGNWVSDFAAVWPYGLWIKGGILALTIGAFLFFRLLLARLPDRTSLDAIVRVWWALLAVMVVAGLLAVGFFDRSPQRYSYDNPGWWARHIRGQHGVWYPTGETELDRAKHWYHTIGFRLLAWGCLLSTATHAASQWLGSDRRDRTGSMLLFLLTAALSTAVWIGMIKGFPWSGVPQRLLLFVILTWFWHVAGVVGSATNGKQRSS
jgi:hypothetical protein